MWELGLKFRSLDSSRVPNYSYKKLLLAIFTVKKEIGWEMSKMPLVPNLQVILADNLVSCL